ncbi:MAG: hypothetical protein ACKVOW_12345 [Chitinophagaceae bacterium]
MRNGIKDAKSGTILFSVEALDKLQKDGYRFVQIKGLNSDKHYDYIEPNSLLLVPYKVLPTDPFKKDIYEPIKSDLLYKWAAENNDYLEIFIADKHFN